MKCGKARKLISLHLTGDLDFLQGETVKEHLIVCDACAEEAESYRESLKALGMLKSRAMPASFWDGYMEELRERIHSSKEESEAPRRFGLRRVYAVVAVAAVVVLAVALVLSLANGLFTPRNPVVPPDAPREMKMNLQMADEFVSKPAGDEKVKMASERVDVILETPRDGDF
jgi:hypothetical protein